MYAVYFEVTGSGSFPIDMLRYERAAPAGEADSRQIEGSFNPLTSDDGPPSILLVKITDNPDWAPTQGRWESFGWKVVPDSVSETQVR